MNNKISTSSVRTSGNNIKNYATKLQTTLNSVKTNINKVDKAWKSQAQTNYSSNFKTLSNKFNDFYNAVNNFGDVLIKVEKKKKKFDKDVSKNAGYLSK